MSGDPDTLALTTGRCGSSGRVVAPLVVLPALERPRPKAGEVPGAAAPMTRFRGALMAVRSELADLADRAPRAEAGIIAFQQAVLDDPEMIDPVADAIAAGDDPGKAWHAAFAAAIAELDAGDDPTWAVRGDDLRELRDRVGSILQPGGHARSAEPADLAGHILWTDRIGPAAFIEACLAGLAGAVVRQASPASHIAIIARSRGVPLLVGASGPLPEHGPRGDHLLDADAGGLWRLPSSAAAPVRAGVPGPGAPAARPGAVATDTGDPVALTVSVDQPLRPGAGLPEAASAVGLVRTEFVGADAGRPLAEAAQTGRYRAILAAGASRPVVFRLFDAGGDKPLIGLTGPEEPNPLLGPRGIRALLQAPDLLAIHIRALLRACGREGAATADLLLPMVGTMEEVTAARAAVDAAATAVRAEGVAVPPVRLGLMVEVPATALTIDRFEADFLVLGGNDLAQYALARSRDREISCYNAGVTHPAVVEMIERTVASARRRDLPLSYCGPLLDEPGALSMVLSAGVRTLVVPISALAPVAGAVRAWPEAAAG